MGVYLENDYRADVALNKVPRTTKQWKFAEGVIGNNPTTVWMGSQVQPGLYVYPDMAYNMDVVSTSTSDTTQTMIIQGLDKHWKYQEELVQLDGTTPVTTQYAYLRINRLSILGGGDLLGSVQVTQTGTTTPIYGYIADGSFERNQTQQGFISVGAGHVFLADSVDLTTFEAKKTNLYILVREWKLAEDLGLSDPPFRVQLNWNLFNGVYQALTTVPISVEEKSDLELRGFTENSTDKATSTLQGVLVQRKSIPVDLTNYSASKVGNSIVVSWDQQTPAETSDMSKFIVTYKIVGQPASEKHIDITDKKASGVTIPDIIPEQEYNIQTVWVGYDGKESAVSSANI